MKYLQDLFEDIYSKLKKEFKKYPVRLLNEEAEGKLADCNYFTNPATINIYLGSIKKQMDISMKNHLKVILTHELIHAINPQSAPLNQNESDAYGKMRKLEFFNER